MLFIIIFVFDGSGGIYLFFKYDFEISKLNLIFCLSSTSSNVLENQLFWNNRTILSRGKSIFMDDWMEKQIWSVSHLMDNSGNILNVTAFIDR